MPDTHDESVLSLLELLQYQVDAIISRVLLKKPAGTVTLFAFDEGQELSEHTTPYDALLQVLEGSVEVRIGGQPHLVRSRQLVVLPASVPHAVRAPERVKFLLTMVKA